MVMTVIKPQYRKWVALQEMWQQLERQPPQLNISNMWRIFSQFIYLNKSINPFKKNQH